MSRTGYRLKDLILFSVLHVSLNVAKLAMELIMEIPEGGQLQIMIVLPNVDSALYVMEI